MNLTRAIKLLRLFSSKSSTPAGACLLRLVIENFLEMMADDACLENSFSWCANSSSSEIGSSLKVCCDSIPTCQQLSAGLSLFYLSGRLGICQKIYTTQFSGERILHTKNTSIKTIFASNKQQKCIIVSNLALFWFKLNKMCKFFDSYEEILH